MTPRPRRRGGRDGGDGPSRRPSQRSGDVDGSSGISTAQRTTSDIAGRGWPGSASGNGRPNQPGQPNEPGSGEQSSRPEWLRQRIEEGNEFNRRCEPYDEEQGGANEVHVEPRSDRGQYPRVDSYVPGEEIVGRTHTQLVNVQESTAIGYLRELANTYGPGTIVADTPTNRRDLGDEAIGQPMDGDMVLEVPVQGDGVPPAVLAEARRLGNHRQGRGR